MKFESDPGLDSNKMVAIKIGPDGLPVAISEVPYHAEERILGVADTVAADDPIEPDVLVFGASKLVEPPMGKHKIRKLPHAG